MIRDASRPGTRPLEHTKERRYDNYRVEFPVDIPDCNQSRYKQHAIGVHMVQSRPSSPSSNCWMPCHACVLYDVPKSSRGCTVLLCMWNSLALSFACRCVLCAKGLHML